MKRRITKLVLFLLLGAVVNVAVAWGCAVTSPIVVYDEFQRDLPDAEVERLWRKYMGGRDENDDSISGQSGSIRGTTRIFLGSMPLGDPVTTYGWSETSDILQAGWPFRSLEGGEYFRGGWDEDKRWNENLVSVRRVLLNLKLVSDPEALWTERTVSWFGQIPTKPIWPGFTINTIFYAAILWLLTLGPFTARRMIRRKRGHCIKCGYDLRGAEHEVCPECGAAGGPSAAAPGYAAALGDCRRARAKPSRSSKAMPSISDRYANPATRTRPKQAQ